MAVSSQISQNKRGRDEYWNDVLVLPNAKRSNSEKMRHDTDVMALLGMIDNMDTINDNPEKIHGAIQLEDEKLNGVMKSMEDEVGLKGQADDIESVDVVDEKGGSINQITYWNPEATSSSDTGDMDSEAHLTYYDDVCAELGFFVDHTAVELGIIMNLLDGDSIANMYSDAVYGHPDTPAVLYESLWADGFWQANEHPDPVIQN